MGSSARRHSKHSKEANFVTPLSQERQNSKANQVLGGVTNPDYQGNIELLLHDSGKRRVWSAGHLLMLPCLVIKVGGKQQQPNPRRMTEGTNSSGMKLWVTSPRKESRLTEVLAERCKWRFLSCRPIPK